jgi:hypothetical protein
LPLLETGATTQFAYNTSGTPVGDVSIPIPPVRFSLSGTTTVYLVAESFFTLTCTAYGTIQARRVR